MRTTTLLASIALVAMTAACGGDSEEPAAAPPATSAETPAAAPPATSPETPAAAPPATSPETPAGDPTVLLGQVGTEDDPDAFELFLTDESGEPVEELPAGSYEIQVTDLSEIHNFHLEGEGVEETTTVPETGETTWQVTFEAGEYTAVCDPHPGMRAELTVT